MIRTFIFLILATSTAIARSGEINMAAGLTIADVADDGLVTDCTAVTVDSLGRVIASGPGYIRLLVDDDGDGRFDRYTPLVDRPGHGAHGLCTDKGNLYYVGDNGVWKVTDTDGDGVVDSSPTRVLEIKTGGEHDAHALRRGPDGHWYLIAGNGTQGMFALQNVSSRSVVNPRAGAIWRISADWTEREVWAHGFRNAYDFDFAPGHSIDTFDSDGERDVSLPWYRPTRVYRVSQGDDAGWVTRSWKRPNIDPQMPHVLAELGRGSPTGVLRYRHRRLPERFHHGVFVLDWTFGRIVFVSDDGQTEVVAQPMGTTGFAVTDIDALPDGRLVVSVGGRRSRGGLYVIDAITPTIGASATTANPSNDLWSGMAPQRESDPLLESVARLRRHSEPVLDRRAAADAVNVLADRDAGRTELITAMTLLIESVGGLGEGDPKDARGKEQVAAVFDGYRSRLRPRLHAVTVEKATTELIRILESDHSDDQLRHEAIRALAVLEPESHAAFAAIVADMAVCKHPTGKLHRLIALARLPVARSDEMTALLAHAMLEIPMEIDQLGLYVDRNWTPRSGELFLAMERRDSLLPSRLVSDPLFGHPSHLVWTESMDPENLERARRHYLMQSRAAAIDPAVARFIALGDDAVPRSFINKWLKEPTTRQAAWLAIASHPRSSDVEQLQQAVLSVDKTTREAAERALKRLGAEIPQRQSTSEGIGKWLQKAPTIIQMKGDAAEGKELFAARNCALCHSGAKALGPPLEGISKRFNDQDLLRATVDPSHHIPDRYRGMQVLTTDDRILRGMVIYESVDGLTLLTADATTVRINADAIADVRPSSKSLMPEGLIDGLSDEQAASLITYLRSM